MTLSTNTNENNVSDLTIQLLSGLGLLILGVIMGATLGRSFHNESKKNKRLEQKVSELENEQMRYRAEVSGHFMKTAELVNHMNQSYRDVHNHLAKGAASLCGDEHNDDFLKVSFTDSNTKEIDQQDGDIPSAPPMDYAPKPDGDAGTLSEGFGLNREEDGEAPQEKAI